MPYKGTQKKDPIDWDKYAECYDAVCVLDPYREMLATAVGRCSFITGTVVLDAGCGTGNLTKLLLAHENIVVYACDASQQMLARAADKCKSRNAMFQEHDLNYQLPFSRESIDVVISINVLYALQDPRYFIGECHRVLRPGGVVVLATPKKGFEMGLVLRAHAKNDTKPMSFWLGVGESLDREIECVRAAIKDTAVQAKVINLARYNKRIVAAGRATTYHFLAEEQAVELISCHPWHHVNFEEIYAGQNWLITLTK